MRTTRRLRGFTLLELLVVLGIIGVLIAIILPAVQRVREAARLAQCRSNLRQLGVGLHSYQSSFGVYPTLITGPGPQNGGVWHLSQSYSPHARLMGHLGYPNVYNAINFHWPMGESYLPAFPPNTTAESMMISLLLCPSDYHAKIRTTGKCSYRYSVGTQDHAPLLALPGAGAFTVYDWAQPGDFPAGLANTAAMSEKVSGDLDIDSYDKLSDAGLVSETLQAKPLDEIVAGCAEQAVYPNVSHAGWSWIQSLYLSNWYNHIVTPNHAVGDCVAYDQRVLIFAHNAVGIFAPRSAHGSGANCMMMDGSVRFVGRDMDLGAWRALGTRAADD